MWVYEIVSMARTGFELGKLRVSVRVAFLSLNFHLFIFQHILLSSVRASILFCVFSNIDDLISFKRAFKNQLFTNRPLVALLIGL